MARRAHPLQLFFRLLWPRSAPPGPRPTPEQFEAHARLLRFYAERRAERLGITFREAIGYVIRRHGHEPAADPGEDD